MRVTMTIKSKDDAEKASKALLHFINTKKEGDVTSEGWGMKIENDWFYVEHKKNGNYSVIQEGAREIK